MFDARALTTVSQTSFGQIRRDVRAVDRAPVNVFHNLSATIPPSLPLFLSSSAPPVPSFLQHSLRPWLEPFLHLRSSGGSLLRDELVR
jgi:hypothetical protein